MSVVSYSSRILLILLSRIVQSVVTARARKAECSVDELASLFFRSQPARSGPRTLFNSRKTVENSKLVKKEVVIGYHNARSVLGEGEKRDEERRRRGVEERKDLRASCGFRPSSWFFADEERGGERKATDVDTIRGMSGGIVP